MPLKDRIKSWQAFLMRPVDASSIAAFRILFGLIMAYYIIVFCSPDILDHKYIQPDFFFSFKLFYILHLPVLPDAWMYILFLVIFIASIGIALGFFYRFFLALFFTAYGYMFLLEKSYFNNHYVLILMVTFLLFFMGAHRCASIDATRKPHLNTQQIPFWNIFLLRAQICILYFFGAVTKLNQDWLNAQNIRIWAQEWGDFFILGKFADQEWLYYFFAYGGLIFDLTISFFLCYRKTRGIAILFVIYFHLMNRWFFNIGIFHYFMIATIVFFLEPDTPRRLFNKVRNYFKLPPSKIPAAQNNASSMLLKQQGHPNLVLGFVIIYLLVQVLLPIRHFFIPGNVNWTLESSRFAWRIVPVNRSGSIKIHITDKEKNFEWTLTADNSGPKGRGVFYNPELKPIFLSSPFFNESLFNIAPQQGHDIIHRPSTTINYVHYLRDELKRLGIKEPIITVDARVSMNGRAEYPIIDSTVNLAEVEYRNFAHNDWILLLPKNAEIEWPRKLK